MERHDPGDPESISAYAKLEFEQFSFFIQTLTLVVGRKARHEDNVDVHLGVSKSISRIHAKIFYQFDAMSWEIEILGKNGAFINERYVQAGSKSALKSTDKLLIGDAHFVFLLPDGAAPPHDPSLTYSSSTVTESVALPTTARPVLPSKILNDPRIVPDHAFATPVAPHHLMAKPSVAKLSETPEASIAQSANGTALNALQNIKVAPPIATPRAYLTTPQNQADYSSSTPGSTQKPFLSGPNIAQVQASYDKSTKNASTIKVETGQQNAENPLWAVTSTEHLGVLPAHLATPESLELQAKTEEERRLQEEEAAAQHAAQLLHQERLARQAREEEEGLILPPAETDPAVIAALQKPSASYATMIYNAIASHEKKKMTLAQIYSWICINHPYYRYIQNGWQNSIRHNLSLNKAFMKVPRTDDEPGKGSFWAVDPESEMLFEGGVYKKKPPRPTPSAPINRGAPVVMKDGKLALNPNFFVGGIQGKAEEVLQTLQAAVQKQLGYGNEPEQASQLARILALALATQLRQAAVGATAPRQHQVQLMHRPSPATQSAMPRYPATPSPSAYRPPMATQMLRPPQPFGSSGTQAPTMPLSKNQPSTSASAAVVPKHPYMTSPYAINANSSLTPTSTQKGQYSATLKTPALPLSALPSASSTIPLTTNTVYYKPYQASNSTSAVSQGTSTKAAAVNAPVRPPISMPTAQSNKNVPPSPASSYTAGIKTGSLTGGKSAPVQPSVPGSAKDLNKIATPGISTATHNSVSSATNSTPNSNQHGSVQIKPVSEQDKLTPLESSTVAPTIAKDVPSNASINLPNPGTTNMATSTIPPFSESQQKNLGLCTPAIGNGTGLVTKPALDSDHPEGSSKAQVPATQSSSTPSIPNGNVPVVLGNSSALRRTSPERTGLPSSAEVGAENAKHKPVEPANKESNHNKAESFRGTNESVAKPPVKPATTGATCTAELLLASTNSSAQVVDSSRTVQPAPGVGNNGNNKRPIEPNAETSVNKMQKSSEPEQATARTE